MTEVDHPKDLCASPRDDVHIAPNEKQVSEVDYPKDLCASPGDIIHVAPDEKRSIVMLLRHPNLIRAKFVSTFIATSGIFARCLKEVDKKGLSDILDPSDYDKCTSKVIVCSPPSKADETELLLSFLSREENLAENTLTTVMALDASGNCTSERLHTACEPYVKSLKIRGANFVALRQKWKEAQKEKRNEKTKKEKTINLPKIAGAPESAGLDDDSDALKAELNTLESKTEQKSSLVLQKENDEDVDDGIDDYNDIKETPLDIIDGRLEVMIKKAAAKFIEPEPRMPPVNKKDITILKQLREIAHRNNIKKFSIMFKEDPSLRHLAKYGNKYTILSELCTDYVQSESNNWLHHLVEEERLHHINSRGKITWKTPFIFRLTERKWPKAWHLTTSFGDAFARLNEYVGREVLSDLDLTKSFITGSAMAYSLFTHPSYAETGAYFPPVYLVPTEELAEIVNSTFIGHSGINYNKVFNPQENILLYVSQATKKWNEEEYKHNVLMVSVAKNDLKGDSKEDSKGDSKGDSKDDSKSEEKRGSRPLTSEMPILIQFETGDGTKYTVQTKTSPGADIDICIDAEGEQFDAIAKGHFDVWKRHWPHVELERVEKPSGFHQWRIVSRHPADCLVFREVQMYCASLHTICGHHLPPVRAGFTKFGEGKHVFMMAASALATAADKNLKYPNINYFASKNKTPQSILLKYEARGFGFEKALPARVRKAMFRYTSNLKHREMFPSVDLLAERLSGKCETLSINRSHTYELPKKVEETSKKETITEEDIEGDNEEDIEEDIEDTK